jgi:hypothetical protein
MEGFGLFDFLKTLLPTPENGHTQQTGFSDGNGEAQQKTTPPASAEPTQAANTAAKNAIVNFMQAHDARARKNKQDKFKTP